MPSNHTKLREFAERATGGEWRLVTVDGEFGDKDHEVMSGHVTVASLAECSHSADVWQAKRDATFIVAASPATVIALLDELDRMNEELRRYVEAYHG